jgi:hypothetical protein
MALVLIVLAVAAVGAAIVMARSSRAPRQAANVHAFDGSTGDDRAAAGGSAHSAHDEPRQKRGGCY